MTKSEENQAFLSRTGEKINLTGIIDSECCQEQLLQMCYTDVETWSVSSGDTSQSGLIHVCICLSFPWRNAPYWMEMLRDLRMRMQMMITTCKMQREENSCWESKWSLCWAHDSWIYLPNQWDIQQFCWGYLLIWHSRNGRETNSTRESLVGKTPTSRPCWGTQFWNRPKWPNVTMLNSLE